MTKKRRAAVLFVLASVCFLVAGFFSRANKTTVFAGELSDCLLRETYTLNENLEIPSASITYNGQTHSATESVLVYPDGKAVVRRSNVLSASGKYKVIYSTEFDGKTVKAEKSFKVTEKLYSVGDEEKSSVYYGSDKRYEDAADNIGICLSLAKGDTFYYNKVIDLNQKKAPDTILKFFAVPMEKGTCDAQTVNVRLTDAYDPENYVSIEIKNVSHLGSWADPVVYCTANAVGQPKSGMTTDATTGEDWCRQNSWAGTVIITSLCATPSPYYYDKVGEDAFTVSMDYSERGVYGRCGNSSSQLIMDLDEAKYLDTLWNGFTTGEAFLSISASRYISSAARYVITDINGDEINSSEFYSEENAKIDVDFGAYTEDSLPKAIVGKEYRIFDFRTSVATGKIVREGAAVYYDYYSASPVTCNLEDGKFIPKREGEYCIVYYAENSFGIMTKKIVKVRVEKREGLKVEISGKAAEGKLGDEIKVVNGITVSDGSGIVNVKLKAADGNGHSYTCDERTFAFRPKYAGAYTVEIEVSDYIETVKETFEVRVSATNSAYIQENPVLPKYFIKGATYKLPTLTAEEYKSGKPVIVPTEILISEDGKAEKKITGCDYKVEANKEVKVIYRSVNDGEKYEKQANVPVADVGYGGKITPSVYFLQDKGVVATQNEDSVTLSTENNDAETTFVNAVNGDEVYLVWRFNKNKSDFSRVAFIVEDSEDGSAYTEFAYVRNGRNVSFYINGAFAYKVSENYDINNPSNLEFRYVNSEKAVYPVRDRSLPVRSNLSGKPFNGFKKVYVTFRFSGVSGASGIDVSVFNRQGLVNAEKDFFAPQMAVKSVAGDRKYGDCVYLKGAVVADVLDPVVKSSLYVKAPSGKHVVAEDGTELDGTCDVSKDYSFIVSERGEYEITYFATDYLSGRTTTYSYGISVIDTVAPVIMLSDAKKEFKPNEKITVAKGTAIDDIDGETKVFVFIKYSSGKMTALNDNLIATEKGEYEIIYTSYDSAGNMAIITYKIKVV